MSLGVNEIRSAFLKFFNKNKHEIVKSSSLIPHNDPTLMFTNAGMVQFKNLFTGLEKPPYSRAVTAQKCVRAGGKHNDLDNVGYTARHHTFFEMLGNFSFGDYFKDTAIELAWDLITKEFKLPKEKLIVTVYHEDEEAEVLWKKISGLSDDKIIKIATSDNFWSMGATGPCGPCSEIFYDHGSEIPGGPPGSPDEDGDRFVEIWNLVFMQYEQLADGERIKLPKPSIDTGMGLERIAAVMQGMHDNYDIDLMKNIIAASEEVSRVKAEGSYQTSHRVIADHLRSISFLLSDGVLPSNEGRGYVLRRIMRRAMRHASILGVKEPMLYKLFPSLLTEMGEAYPELQRGQDLITKTIKHEEIKFRNTLDRGLKILDDEVKELKSGQELSGEVAFKLYDTYGFPLDLTQDALRDLDISVDIIGFDAAMEKQKTEARKSWKGSGEKADDEIWFTVSDKAGASEFLGYCTEYAKGQIVAIIKDGSEVEQICAGWEAILVLNQTPFYGESGGQVGDHGVIGSDAAAFLVTDTQKKIGDVIAHIGHLQSGSLKLHDTANLYVDHVRRTALRANHSGTHIVYQAMRWVLGEHVIQKGSQVTPERLRFDFSHNKSLTVDELEQIERISNSIIKQNSPVATKVMAIDDAMSSGALALFGEKYGDEVRVITMGQNPDNSKQAFSVELCGGTHVTNTGDIGLLKIISETAISSGVRRIEAITGNAAIKHIQGQERRLKDVASILKVAPQQVTDRVTSLLEERKVLEQNLKDTKKKLAIGGEASGSSSVINIEEIAGVKFLAQVFHDIEAKELRGMVDSGKSKIGSGIVVMAAIANAGKVAIAVGVTDDLISEYNAVDLVKIGASEVGGKGGGGRPDMAQAGGSDSDNIDKSIAAIKQKIDSND